MGVWYGVADAGISSQRAQPTPESSLLVMHFLEAAGDGSSTWVPVTHMGALDQVLESWL